MRILECVPNISEGRDRAMAEAAVDAVRQTPGVAVLDHSSDADHNRSVITFVGEPEAVLLAVQALSCEVLERIDMRQHHGGHPRMGALDVVPFVPLREVSTEEAVAVARRFGAWLGDIGVPVFYYEDAASTPERKNLADVRRGEYEGLAERLARPEWRPDEGPAGFDPRWGATAVGVRFPLIAFNVNLGTTDLGLADRIAQGVRHVKGGYRYVKAMAVPLEGRGLVQVSMNLVRYDRTPIHRVVETIRSEAAAYGVPVVGCELIGLAPVAAFEETLRFSLQMHDFSMDQVVETRLLDLEGSP
jgi:glutamate formiminotransferase